MSAPPPQQPMPQHPVPPHMQGKRQPPDGPQRMAMIKREAPCTAALDPSYFQYVLDHTGETEVQRELREAAEKLSRPGMMACPDQYQFLGWLCGLIGAKRVIEVGVFRGVTTLAMALQLPEDGIIRGLDISREFAEVGIEAWEKAGVSKKIDFMEGPALASLQLLIDRGEAGSYDLVFIDANKDQYPEYYELSLQLLRQGGVVVMDNTLLHGLVLTQGDSEMHLPQVGQANDLIKNDKRVAAVMTSMADGVYFARKL